MPYEKYNPNIWVNDVTPVDEAHMNHIEQGIAQISEDITTISNNYNELKSDKQDKLISGTNIKTINNQSILGSGDINNMPYIKNWHLNRNKNDLQTFDFYNSLYDLRFAMEENDGKVRCVMSINFKDTDYVHLSLKALDSETWHFKFAKYGNYNNGETIATREWVSNHNDDALNETSINAVQNKVISKRINDIYVADIRIVDVLSEDLVIDENTLNSLKSRIYRNALTPRKLTTLIFDNVTLNCSISSFYNDTEAMGTRWMHYVLTSSYYTNGKLYNVYLVFGCDGTSNAKLTQELIKIVEVGSGGVSYTEA